jgi:hypothetical protein
MRLSVIWADDGNCKGDNIEALRNRIKGQVPTNRVIQTEDTRQQTAQAAQSDSRQQEGHPHLHTITHTTRLGCSPR